MTDAMPLDELIQEPAPDKIERLRPPGADTRQTIGAGFNTAEENSVETPRPLMREVPPAEPFPVDALGGVLRGSAEAIHDRTQAPPWQSALRVSWQPPRWPSRATPMWS